MLPAEADLAATYGVNRLTVRHALGDLARQGLVTITRGRRTTVASPPVRYRLAQNPGASLSSAMAEQGLAVIHEPTGVEPVPVTDPPFALDGAGPCVRFDTADASTDRCGRVRRPGCRAR